MRPRLVLALLVGLALVVVALSARGASPVPYEDRGGGEQAAPTITQPPAGDAGDVERGSVVGGSLVLVVLVLILMTVVVIIGLLSVLRLPKRRKRRGTGAVGETADDVYVRVPELLVRGAREALEDLSRRTGGPPRDAVVFAWLRLEEAAADSGVERLPHQTATEFTGGLLARFAVDEEATDRLRRAYQRARFGTAEVTEDDARVAREALEHIVRDLDGSRA
ncbi:hypothetical protein GCM10010492_12010 [Saccharothrix mutabilis subsp. mutabilis]|uniref:Protein-glutamine gamma-glutamyltransferase-like C-terminal domain-containing protein n=1 Tax=Saccharothrix mutabilis subsp. mutabilis TaxID=66855 RepID=A0ABN0T991_9PSEU